MNSVSVMTAAKSHSHKEKKEVIKEVEILKEPEIKSVKLYSYPTAGQLAKPGVCFLDNEIAERIYQHLIGNPEITDFTVVNFDGIAVGFMTKTDLNEALGGRYGFSLHAKREISDLAYTEFLRVSHNMHADAVSRLAMKRAVSRLYDPVIVEREGRYAGVVTIKDLLETCMKTEIDIAVNCNPLTGLPGNIIIEKEIRKKIFKTKPYCIIYFDLDNFKAYNDAYGFQNGDLMLALVSDTLKKCAVHSEFIGHIGGDDFIAICPYTDGEEFCRAVITEFSEKVILLYSDEDIKRGYIVSKNRNGLTESFPIASLSIAGISDKDKSYTDITDFSNDIAKIKKKCKQHEGNYYEIH